MIDPPLAELVELDWTLHRRHRLNIPSSPSLPPLLHFLRSQESTCIPPVTVYLPNCRENHTSYRAGIFLPIWTPPPKLERRPSFSTAICQLDLAPPNPPCNACRLSGLCNHAFKVNKNHHRRTSDTRAHRPDSRVGTELDHLHHWRLATGTYPRISTPLSLPAIASPASSPPQSHNPTIPPFVLFAGPTSIPRSQDHAE